MSRLDDAIDGIRLTGYARKSSLKNEYILVEQDKSTFKNEIKSLMLELIPKNVDTSKYKADDEHSFMLGYTQACIEIEQKVNEL